MKLFRIVEVNNVGFKLVVVGGSAVEFYTEGDYMSGDIDFYRQDVMAKLRVTGGPRSWQVCGLFVDMHGFLENESTAPMRTVETPLMASSLQDPSMDWVEVERLAGMDDFKVLQELKSLKAEVENA